MPTLKKIFKQEHKDANSRMFCFGVVVFMFPVQCFALELASLFSLLFVCFGFAVFMFLFECFVLELASLCNSKTKHLTRNNREANSKTKHLTRNKKKPTPKQNIQLGI
jgi:hypothetical protein